MAGLIDAIRAGQYLPLEAVAPRVHVAIANVVARCLRVSSSDRFANAGLLHFALLKARQHAGLAAPRRRGLVLAIAAVLLAALSACALLGTNSILVPIATGQWDYLGYTVMDVTLTPAFRIAGGVLLGAAVLCAVLAVVRWRSRAGKPERF